MRASARRDSTHSRAPWRNDEHARQGARRPSVTRRTRATGRPTAPRQPNRFFHISSFAVACAPCALASRARVLSAQPIVRLWGVAPPPSGAGCRKGAAVPHSRAERKAFLGGVPVSTTSGSNSGHGPRDFPRRARLAAGMLHAGQPHPPQGGAQRGRCAELGRIARRGGRGAPAATLP